MRKKGLFLLLISVFLLNGCAIVLQKGRRSDVEKIEILESELSELKNTKNILEDRLSMEIEDKQVRLKMAEKGLVITFVAEVLYDSGKAKLRKESYPTLDKVIRILQEEVPVNEIGIEGHTDNEPIKFSRWKSNWELSSQRALGVLYYLEDEGVDPTRLSAIGYGQYQSVASNDTVEGRKFNRRVEIVILPKTVKGLSSESAESQEEELK
jgi:chemotaxis protein MotB